MKTPSADLWELVRALTPSEKRYFKIFAQQAGQKDANYLELYEAIEAMPGPYDEDLLKADHPQAGFIKQLSFTKNYLYNLILKSLEYYHADRNSDIQLRSLMNSVQILFDKGLYEQCEKQLRKAAKMAEKYDKVIFQMEVTVWKMALMNQQLKVKEVRKHLEAAHQENMHRLKSLEGFLELRYLSMNGSAMLLEHGVKVADVETRLAAFEDVVQRARQVYQKTPHSFMVKAVFLDLMAYYENRVRNSVERTLDYRQQLLQLLEENPHQIEQKPFNLVFAYYNYLYFCLEHKVFDDFEANLERMVAIAEKKVFRHHRQKLRSMVFAREVNLRLSYHLARNDWPTAIREGHELAQRVKKWNGELEPQTEGWFALNQCFIHLLEEDLSGALQWVNHILNGELKELRKDIQLHARMIELLIHLLRLDYDLVEYRLASTRRFLNKEDKLFVVEDSYLAWVRKALRAGHTNGAQVLQHLKKTLDTGELSVQYRNLLGYFNFMGWVESVIPRLQSRQAS